MNKKKLTKCLKYLFSKYNHLGIWWPGNSKIEIIVSTVLTQITNRKNVEKVLLNLMEIGLLPSDCIISNSNINSQLEIEKIILTNLLKKLRIHDLEGIGFKKRKHKTITDVLKLIEKVDFDQNTFEIRKRLLQINGVGKETADSILCYGLDKKIFVVDNYTYKVLGINKNKLKYDALRENIENILKEEGKFNLLVLKNLHGAFVEEGKCYSI